jgi:hypothetical protein
VLHSSLDKVNAQGEEKLGVKLLTHAMEEPLRPDCRQRRPGRFGGFEQSGVQHVLQKRSAGI